MISKNFAVLRSTHRPEATALEELHSTFIQNVEHELRTPLSLVQGYADLLDNGDLGELLPAQKDAVLIIANRSYQMRTLIDRLGILLASKARNGISTPNEVEYLINGAIETQRPAALKKNLTLKISLEPKLPLVYGDPRHLQTMLVCLLENAIKFTPTGGRIEVQANRLPDCIQIVVSDTGIGIETDKLANLGLDFSQADSSSTRSYGGLGLGLTLARSVVEEHAGQLEVDSRPGQGCRFAVKLPLVSAHLAGAQHTNGIPYLLLVDDDENVLLTMQAGLKMLLDCEIVIATSGEQALQLFDGRPFDLLLTDYKMPGMDGLALAAQVRKSYPQTGIVIITAYFDDRLNEQAAEIEVHAILNKPVNLADVRTAALDTLVNSRFL
jgi:CheY-like chemotaxis protein